MATSRDTDGLLVEWGERLFRRGGSGGDDTDLRAADGRRLRARLSASSVRQAIREIVRPGARQVMVKITGGGRGAAAMVAHLRYISRQGQEEVGGRGRTLGVVDERGDVHQGSDAMRRLVEEWRCSGSWIPEQSHRREAYHVIFSMPSGTQAHALLESVAATAERLFDGHRYAMAMHLDQGAPHVHVMVRAERRDGVRLNPRKADLERWRATFARELQARGVDAVATRQVARGVNRAQADVWELRAREAGRLRRTLTGRRSGRAAEAARAQALEAWRGIARVLAMSGDPEDRRLAGQAAEWFVRETMGRGGTGRRQEDADRAMPGQLTREADWPAGRGQRGPELE